MAITMNKELLIRLPASLYEKIKCLCDREYKSISALVRELLLEKVDETLTSEEIAHIEKESKLFYKGKGANWRKVKRG
ncbi:MAG: ribbon-helix-helix protein, CopG family [Candidatus Omnitrophota bacterium]